METMSITHQPRVSHDLANLASPIPQAEAPFPFLSLPLEIRRKIYTLLLPPRTHTIVTALPTNGLFYNTSLLPPINPRSTSSTTAPSYYPFGRVPPTDSRTYKVLTTNFRPSYPSPTLQVSILRTSSQVYHEALPVLYGAAGVTWDFGTHAAALRAFWADRSALARAHVRCLRIAKEIPCFWDGVRECEGPVDEGWTQLAAWIKSELPGLRGLDLTLWSSSGAVVSFPASGELEAGEDRAAMARRVGEWRRWVWTRDLLALESLRRVVVQVWGFQNVRDDTNFDSWLAGRMVGDRVVKQKLIKEGVVRESRVVLPGIC